MENEKKGNLLRASLFGILFGFFLQKGGVAKYHVLVGQLLLVDFTVAKIMLTAILTGMIGHYFLLRRGKAPLQIKPLQPLANVAGGLIFGTGFALAGFCPGTGAAALGEGQFAALFYVSGMLVGSYLYAESSTFIQEQLKKWHSRGEVTLADYFGARRNAVLSCSILIMGILLVLRRLT